MSKLYFRYGAMGSGKTIDLLKVAYNYKERGQDVVIYTAKIDDRYEVGKVTTRIGIQSDALTFDTDTNIYRQVKLMDKKTGNCTNTKAGITVKTVFDGNQSGQQAFMKLIQRQYRISGADMQNAYIDKSEYSIDKTQYTDYTKDSESNVGGTTVGFAENG